MSNDLRTKVEDLNAMISQGKIMEAMNAYYHPNVSMQENSNPPTVGLEANIKREAEFVANTEWHGLEFKNIAVNDRVTMVESFMDFTNKQYGKRMAFTQVAVQQWQDGKIINERFYYDPS